VRNSVVLGAPQAAIAVSTATPLLQKICKKSCYSSIRLVPEPAGTRNCDGEKLLLRVVVAAEKFIPFDGGDDANGTFVARFGPLNAA
jgi:hypothetical protein